MRKFEFWILLFAVFLIIGCATVYNPATGHKEYYLIDSSAEASIGNNISQTIEQKYRLSSDPAFNQKVQMVGQRVAAVSDRKDVKYQFKVVENKEINAFALPGGYVYVNTGLLRLASDDELAGVIAHEVGHIAARHSVKALQADLGFNILASIASGAIGNSDFDSAVGITYGLISNGYSREDERQADKLSVKYSYLAGYDPRGILTFLEKLRQKEGYDPSAIEVFLRTHPSTAERIRNVESEIAFVTGKTNMPKERFCPTCGRRFENEFLYCPKDGAELRKVVK